MGSAGWVWEVVEVEGTKGQKKIAPILATLHAAPTVAHMDLPGLRLHPLKGR